jgi:hypothetical protein
VAINSWLDALHGTIDETHLSSKASSQQESAEALELLAVDQHGLAEALLLTYGFTRDLLAGSNSAILSGSCSCSTSEWSDRRALPMPARTESK